MQNLEREGGEGGEEIDRETMMILFFYFSLYEEGTIDSHFLFKCEFTAIKETKFLPFSYAIKRMKSM